MFAPISPHTLEAQGISLKDWAYVRELLEKGAILAQIK